MEDLRQTKEYAKYMESLGFSSSQLPVPNCQIFVRNIPLIGKIAKLQRPEKIDYKVLNKWIKENNIKVCYIEPPLTTYLLSKACFVPSKTIHINLRQSEQDLLNQCKPKTRYNIKVAQKRGVVFQESKDIDAFVNLWSKSAQNRGMWLPQKKEIHGLCQAFGKKVHLLLAFPSYKTNEPIAGVLLACSKDAAYYMYAGSLNLGKKLFAPTLLAWETIKLAKRKAYKTFDFEGIYDERYHSQTKAWQGFTRFKEGFGGKVVIYPPTLVKYSNLLCRFLI